MTQTTVSYTAKRTLSAFQTSKCLSVDNINPSVREAKYAVRGELAVKAEEYRQRLNDGDKSLPFESVIFANIGNPQQLDQKPITFFRQVLSLVENPLLLENPEVLKTSFGYKQDVIERAQTLLANVQSVGAYSHSQGAPGIRNSVAKFIENRDGFPANPQDLFLTAGASSGVSTLLSVICNNESAGVLVPIPQYPLYTATLSLLNARCVPYLLEEEKAWGTDVTAILKSIEEAKAAAINVRAVVVINPGNPTGASLSADDIKKVLDVAAEESLVVIADEVYQTNVFKGEFVSFKKRLRQLQKEEPGKYDDVELVSLHSISKGMVGECGHRGGYFELVGFDPLVQEQIYKLVSIGLCPPVVAQCLLECMVNPPVQGEPSYELYQKEYSGIAEGLHKRALSLYNAFQRMEGVEVQEPQVCLHTPYFPSLV
jgi:alanine transaminase